MKTSTYLLTFFFLIISTAATYAYCDVELLIIPPKDDGGEKIDYYRVEYMNIERGVWAYHDCNAQYPYKEQLYTLCNLTWGVQYMFRVRAINKYGVGEPGAARLTAKPLKDGETIKGFEVQCGPGKSSLKSVEQVVANFPIFNANLLNLEPSKVMIPYRIE